jgi:hypothetical protein
LAIEIQIEELAHEHHTLLQVTMKVEDQLALILTKLNEQSETNRHLTDVHDSMAELTTTKADFERWRPKVDDQVAYLHDCVNNLRQQLDKLKSSLATQQLDGLGSASLKVPRSAHLDPSSSKAAPRPIGHDVETHHRNNGSEVVYMTTHEPPPVNRTKHGFHHTHSDFDFWHHASCGACSHMTLAMPQLDFPKFDGTSPKLWINLCDTYFDLNGIPIEN